MEEILSRIGEDLALRIHGPLTFRFLMQPVITILFATHAGLRDAREHRPPYFWALLYDPGHRHEMLRQGWHEVGKIFVLAIVLDVIYQVIVLQWVYPGEVLIIAVVLAFVPYLIFRGLITRIAHATRRRTGRPDSPESSGTPP